MFSIDELVGAINHALDCGRIRLQWYSITKDEKYMKECKEWNTIASYYMNELINKQKCGVE